MTLTLQRNIILALLIASAAASWTVLIRQQTGMDAGMEIHSPTIPEALPTFQPTDAKTMN